MRHILRGNSALLSILACLMLIFGCEGIKPYRQNKGSEEACTKHSTKEGKESVMELITVGGEQYNVELAFSDDFSGGLENWVIEGGGEVWIEDGRLHMEAFDREDLRHVATAVCKKEFSGDTIIEFEATILPPEDRSNINFFCYMTLADGSDILTEQRTGAYSDYHSMNNYIFTFLRSPEAPDKGRYRFRKCPGFRLLSEDYADPVGVNITHKIAIIIHGSNIKFLVNDTIYHDYDDPEPVHKNGKHGLRTFMSRLYWDNFKVWKIHQKL